jgi:integrase
VERKTGRTRRVKYWEIIADNLKKAGWRCGSISITDHDGRQFWVVAAERADAGRFIVHADTAHEALGKSSLTPTRNAEFGLCLSGGFSRANNLRC